MCDIDNQIRQWRGTLGKEEVYTTADLEELEIHLREEIIRLTDSGLSQTEAFMVATHRLGNVNDLTHEFTKVNSQVVFCRHLLWMCIGVMVYLLAAYWATGFSKGVTLVAALGGLRGYDLGLVTTSMRLVLFICGILVLIYGVKRTLAQSRRPRWFASFKGKLFLVGVIATVDTILIMGPIFFTALTARVITPADYGKMSLINVYGNLIWPIVTSFVLVALIITLYNRSLASE